MVSELQLVKIFTQVGSCVLVECIKVQEATELSVSGLQVESHTLLCDILINLFAEI